MNEGLQGVSGLGTLNLLSLFHASGLRVPNLKAGSLRERAMECMGLIELKVKKQDIDWARNEANAAASRKVNLIALGQNGYPRRLNEIDDPPLVLFVAGNLPNEDAPMVGIVGTRNATRSGAAFAREIAKVVTSAGGVVISGLAMGIDGAAHQGALDAIDLHSNGKADLQFPAPGIAVLGAGLNHVTPQSNINIHDSILKLGGAAISEFGMNVHPTKFTFPQRNRIISGMADCIIVIEAKERSGALITARTALEQGREVLVVPGSPLNPACAGSNRLLRDGATPLVELDDLFTYLPGLSRHGITGTDRRRRSKSENLDPESRIIIELLEQKHSLTFDQLVEESAISAENLAPKLSDLELDGAIHLHPGSLFSISPFLE